MSYTVWSHGRLVGYSDLDVACEDDDARRGWFRPAPDTNAILDVAIGVEVARLAAEQSSDRETAAADVASAIDQCAALELELQGPDGKPIATTDIVISDTVLAIFGEPDGDRVWYEQLTEEERKLFDESVERQCEILESLERERRAYGDVSEEDDDLNEDDFRYEVSVKLRR